MQKRVFFTVLLAIFALTSMAEGLTYLSTADFKAKVCFYDLASGQQPAWKYIGDKPCLIDFSTTWCGWCKKLHPILEQVAKQYEGKVYVYTLDAEKEPEVAALFGVRSYPTVVFCPMEGGPRIAQGYHELDYWQEAIKQILDEDPRNIEETENIKDKAVKIEEPRGNGSGFFVGTNIVATNYHVIQDANRIEIVIQTPQKISRHDAKVLCVDKINDLALVMIEDSSFQQLQNIPYNIQYRRSEVGTSIFAMGYPMAHSLGSEIKITDGIINSKTGYKGQISTYQISAPIHPGNSGGPLFDKKGHLIAITSAGIPEANNVGYAIKSSYLHQLIEAAPIHIKDITQEPSEQKFEDMIKKFSPYVVMVLIY